MMEEDMIQELSRQLQENKDEIARLNQGFITLHKYAGMLQQQIDKHSNAMEVCADFLEKQSSIMDNLRYESIALQSDESVFFPKFRSNEETIRLIREEKKSLGRFGDGEFALAFHIPRQKFQRVDERLADRIRQVFVEENEKLLIGIPNQYGQLDQYNDIAKKAIREYMTKDVRLMHKQLISLDKVYSDTYMTRPYVCFTDCFTEEPKKRFDALKTIWENKNIYIVEGAQTRLGMGNDLFDGAKAVRRILAPATSSFDRYDDILQYCLENGHGKDLFILAIGPSSGVLASDLSKAGFQAIDVGHLDMEYEWFLAGEGKRVSIPNKYNNEVIGGDQVTDFVDEKYSQEIEVSFV